MTDIAVPSRLELWGFELLARYLRLASLHFGQWRLRLFGVRQARRLAPSLGTRVVNTRYGFRMRLDLRDWGDQFIYVTGDYEDYTSQVFRALLRPGDTVADIGANAGFFTLLASTLVGRTGHVIAFEPVPAVRQRLSMNLELNRKENAEVRAEALNDSAGKMTLFSASSENTGLSSFRPLNESAQAIEIDTVTWDAEIDLDRDVRLIKMDVEGAECRVLRGMTRYLNHRRQDLPDMIIEVSAVYLAQLGDSASELCEQLLGLGYHMFLIQWDGLIPLAGWRNDLPDQFNALFTAREVLPAHLKVLDDHEWSGMSVPQKAD